MCLRRRGARHSSQLQVQGQEVAPDSGMRVLGIFGGNGRFASKVGYSSEQESTRNVGNQRCCNMQNSNSQHLYTRFIRRIAGASILCSLLACTVLRMESRLLLPRGSLTYPWEKVRIHEVRVKRSSRVQCVGKGQRWKFGESRPQKCEPAVRVVPVVVAVLYRPTSVA